MHITLSNVSHITKPAIGGIATIVALALLASCTQPDTTRQITTLTDKASQLQQSLTEAKAAQAKSDARFIELSAKVAQLEGDLTAAKHAAPAPIAASQPTAEPYVVGLGEIMGLTQMRHAKLWFAGDNQNWPLASYELDEIKEGFADVVKFHPTHDGVPQPLTELVPLFTAKPLASLEKAIEAKDRLQFAGAFDELTNGCNSCHMAANFGFNVITRPASLAYSNQNFTPKP